MFASAALRRSLHMRFEPVQLQIRRSEPACHPNFIYRLAEVRHTLQMFFAIVPAGSAFTDEQGLVLTTNPSRGSVRIGDDIEVLTASGQRQVIGVSSLHDYGAALDTLEEGTNGSIRSAADLPADFDLERDLVISTPGVLRSVDTVAGRLTFKQRGTRLLIDDLLAGFPVTVAMGIWLQEATVTIVDARPVDADGNSIDKPMDDGGVLSGRVSKRDGDRGIVVERGIEGFYKARLVMSEAMLLSADLVPSVHFKINGAWSAQAAFHIDD